jgi:hypothetical protein
MTRIELMESIGKDFPRGRGVEVGVYLGEFSKEIMTVWGGTLYMVDVWDNIAYGYNDAANNSVDAHNIVRQAMENIKGFENRAIMIRAASVHAAKIFADNSLDFVYIDANHAYDYVVDDIDTWYTKVAPGGYLCGHDYIKMNWYNDPNFAPNGKDKYIYTNGFFNGVFGVNPAVDEFCERIHVKPEITDEWFGTWIIRKPIDNMPNDEI